MSQSNHPPPRAQPPPLTPLTRTRPRVLRLSPATSPTTAAASAGITDDEAFAAAYKDAVFVPPPPADEFVSAYSRRGYFRLASSLNAAHAAPYTPPPKPAAAPTNAMSRPEQANTRSPPTAQSSQQHTLGIGRAPITPTQPQRTTSDPVAVATRPAAVDMNRSISAPAALPPIFVFGAGVQQSVPAAIHPSFDFTSKTDASSSNTTARRVSNASSIATNARDSPPRRASSTASSTMTHISSLSRRTSDASSSHDTSEPRSPPALSTYVASSDDSSEALSQPRRASEHPEEPHPKRARLTKPRKSTTWVTGDTFLMPSDRGVTFKVYGEQLWLASPKLRRLHLANKKHMITFTHPLETADNIEMALNLLLKRQPPAEPESAIPLLRLLAHWECDRQLKVVSELAWRSLNVGGISCELAFRIAAEADDYELAFRVVAALYVADDFGSPLAALPDQVRRYYIALRAAYIDEDEDGEEDVEQAWARHMRETRRGTAALALWTRK
ncbi:uncharacterized protein LOC62_03G003907 [Vanrija pseudolonga]|uniref:Uncharacterized protein n=1 Tax=Vanrija pseudolonga TaxID=143232 RepID=A0AAF0Y586_9TREE|nr:hypothetical protein LOC62_03G003907 [Vanrija pseudolonga]